ncbi:MAG: hypothetical protein QME12_05150 [Nanoarchaeota archaeon]|nr:hypothetical protein [Nanoarchaeota archaeon]
MAERLSTFLRIFGDSPLLRVMDFLVIHEEFDYSMTDIAREAGIGYSTLKLFWPTLESSKIVAMTREVGKAKLYRLNNKNQVVARFREFYWAATKSKTRQIIAEKIAVGAR